MRNIQYIRRMPAPQWHLDNGLMDMRIILWWIRHSLSIQAFSTVWHGTIVAEWSRLIFIHFLSIWISRRSSVPVESNEFIEFARWSDRPIRVKVNYALCTVIVTIYQPYWNGANRLGGADVPRVKPTVSSNFLKGTVSFQILFFWIWNVLNTNHSEYLVDDRVRWRCGRMLFQFQGKPAIFEH